MGVACSFKFILICFNLCAFCIFNMYHGAFILLIFNGLINRNGIVIVLTYCNLMNYLGALAEV